MLANEQISLRLGTSEDSDFLYDLHRAAMQQYVAQTWGWDEAWQRNYFQQHFNPAECQIITFEGKDIGVLSVRNRETEVLLKFIEVLPEYQNQGIGTAVIKSVLEEAHHTGQPVGALLVSADPFSLIGAFNSRRWRPATLSLRFASPVSSSPPAA